MILVNMLVLECNFGAQQAGRQSGQQQTQKAIQAPANGFLAHSCSRLKARCQRLESHADQFAKTRWTEAGFAPTQSQIDLPSYCSRRVGSASSLAMAMRVARTVSASSSVGKIRPACKKEAKRLA